MEQAKARKSLGELSDKELDILSKLKAEIFGHDKSFFNTIADIEDAKQVLDNLQEIKFSQLKELGISILTVNRIRLKILGKNKCDLTTTLWLERAKIEYQV